jgi:hypothetical protein
VHLSAPAGLRRRGPFALWLSARAAPRSVNALTPAPKFLVIFGRYSTNRENHGRLADYASLIRPRLYPKLSGDTKTQKCKTRLKAGFTSGRGRGNSLDVAVMSFPKIEPPVNAENVFSANG